MDYSKIEFLPIKKYHKNYISYSHLNNKRVAFVFKDVKLHKTLYRKNEKIYIQILFDSDNIKKLLEKLKIQSMKYIEKKFNFNNIEKNYISLLNDNILEVEVHPDCIFKKRNQFDIDSEEYYMNLKEGDKIDIILVFKGILFGKKRYKNLLNLYEITRHYNEVNLINDCILNVESDEESDDNLKIYSDKYKKRFNNFFIEEKETNKKENIVKDILNNIINNIVN
jgi:hypothetical protein